MPFNIPDESEAAFPHQAVLTGTDLEAVAGGAGFTGVLRGGEVTGFATMVLNVTSGVMVERGQRFNISAATPVVPTAHATLPRFDIVVAYYYGVTTIVQGTAAASPIPPSVPDGAVLLAQVYVPANDTAIAANQIIDKRVMIEDENEYATELSAWNSALANRSRRNANIWLVGDSLSEGYGALTVDKTWKQLFRQAIQQPYRYGGAGYIPAQNYATLTGDASPGAPANGHLWTFTGGDGGVPDPGVTYGIGFGLRARWMAAGATATLVFYGDAVRPVFWSTTATGTAAITVDGATVTGSPFSTVGVAGPNTAKSLLISGLAIGWHTMVITATTAIVVDGAEVMNGDVNLGVHLWDGARSGMTSVHFDPRTINGTGWMNVGFQPFTSFAATDGVLTNGSTTFTSASASFTTRDVGEWIVFNDPTLQVRHGAAKIVGYISSTQVTLDRPGLSNTVAATVAFRLNRSESAGWAFTAGTYNVTGATGLTQADEGKYIVGSAAIPSGTKIVRVTSATTCTMSRPAASSLSGQTVRILNREAFHASPDLLIYELGVNDMTAALSVDLYKASTYATIVGGIERTGQDRCSVMLMSMWGPGYDSLNFGIIYSTVSGTNQVTLTNFPAGIFHENDIGKTLASTGGTAPTGFAATVTISAVSADGRTATVSANATSTQNGVAGAIQARLWSDRVWQPYRRALRELADENGWAFWDLYEFGGFIGTTDPNSLTMDLSHANVRGSEWVADRLNQILTGMPKTASLPAGLGDRAGQMLKATAADQWKSVPGVLQKVTADVSNSATATPTDITEWDFYIGPNETLSFQFNLIFTSAALTTGIVFRLTPVAATPAVSNPVDLIFAGAGPATTASTITWVGANGTAWTTTISFLGSALAVPTLAQVVGSVTAGAVGGLIRPQFNTEVNASACTLQRGSWALVV